MARPRVRLVVTADDFGYCPRRDEGIVEAFLAGAVTSVSLLVNGAASESAAELARRHRIPTGLHANLSEGRPVGPARHGASSLLGSEGFFLGKMGFREAVAAGEVVLPQVRKCGFRKMLVVTPPELRPEGSRRAGGPAEPFPGITGQGPYSRGRAPARARAPRCVGWCSQVWVGGVLHVPLPDSAPPAGVCQVFAEALQACGVRFTRLPMERGVGGCTWLEAPARAFACAVEQDARAAMGPFARHGLRSVPPPAYPCPLRPCSTAADAPASTGGPMSSWA
ncbi:carbohydrate deacetylase isoform X4 [Physeter macrocephalus]|uniref:Carbohydrate deacetylase n=1 Tax=Physeter macrocephalus TaxID=9755 RepID=A0A455AJP5_PHYMC|nr:carbohydrate deacetylase isoform X4 [Physeter catodon]|eukprot:XP_028336009.1 carbohydrate deacetylase isoform X4 [Physeter catodon]